MRDKLSSDIRELQIAICDAMCEAAIAKAKDLGIHLNDNDKERLKERMYDGSSLSLQINII